MIKPDNDKEFKKIVIIALISIIIIVGMIILGAAFSDAIYHSKQK